jgi:tetratricopeptide (TPR) repeat protein
MWVASVVVAIASGSGCRGNPQAKAQQFLAAGQQSLHKGDYQTAAIQIRSALQLDPKSTDAQYALAQTELALHEWPDAAHSLDRTLEIDPSRLDARLSRAQLYLAAREFAKAADDASTVVEKDSQSGAAYRVLGAALAGDKQLDQAVLAFTRATTLAPTDPVPLVDLALVEASLHRFGDAETHLNQAIALDRHAVSSYLDLASVLRLQTKVAQADAVLQQGIAANPNAIDLYVKAADFLYAQKKATEADALLSKLRSQAPASVDAAIALGAFYAQHGQLARAVAEYDRGLATAPTDHTLQKRLVDAYLQAGQTARAASLDGPLMHDLPHDTTVHVNHARILLAEGKVDEAVTQLQADATDAADSPQVHYYLALAYWRRNDLTLARRELNSALRLAPDMRMAQLSAVDLCLAQRDLTSADRYGQQYVRQYPDDEAGHIALGVAYFRENFIGQAQSEFLAARRLAPADPVPTLNLAQTYEAEHKWADAEGALDSALRTDPKSVTALGQLADYWVARKEPDRAVPRVRQYLVSHPDAATGYLILGSLELDGAHYADAQAALERSLQLDPTLTTAYVRLGRLYQAQQQTPVAIARYEKAFELQPKQVWLCTLIGNLYLDEGNLDAAKAYYARALAIKSDFGIAAGNLAWVDVRLGGDLDTALSLARKAKGLNPDSVPITDTLGWILYQKGLADDAVDQLRDCTQKMPEVAQYHYHLGKALVATGDLAQAKTELQAALRLKLAGTEAADARKTLTTIG